MQCTPDDAHATCEYAPARVGANDAYINVLSATLPQCDRKAERMLRDDERAETCHVYCAQRSCSAAKAYMHDHADALAARCERVVYLRNGALSMNPDDLVDGAACHAQILAHNARDDSCLTCRPDTGVPVRAAMDGGAIEGARLTDTDEGVPDWFRRANVWAPLPPNVTCDARARNPPVEHTPPGARSVLEFDTDDTPISPDATLAYWAAHTSSTIREAHVAYGAFENAGIASCAEGTCKLALDAPGSYTAEGKVFAPHVHFVQWRGDHWDPRVHTLTL